MGTTATAIFLVILLVTEVKGHGMLMQPPSRSSMWRLGYVNPQNYNDNSLYCGGFAHRIRLGNKCGVCGDPWDGPRDNEAGGKYAKGIITAHYKPGQEITIRVTITASHMGWFEFRLCPNNDVTKVVKQECLDKYLLRMADGSGTRYVLKESRVGDFNIRVKLPDELTCTQCVLQWKWKTGNSWGVDPDTKRGCVGCGDQEEFYGCSDVAIQSDGSEKLETTLPKLSTSTTTMKTPTHIMTTYKPTQHIGHITVTGQKCWATHLWAGNPQLDAFCQKTCDKGNCPSVGCICEKIILTMIAPTTTTTTTAAPTTKLHKIPQRDATGLVPLSGYICRSADLSSGDPAFDALCQVACERGNCSLVGCICDKPDTATMIKATRSTATSFTTTAPFNGPFLHSIVCKATDLWEGDPRLDRYCQEACSIGNCPSVGCLCTATNTTAFSSPDPTSTDTPPTTKLSTMTSTKPMTETLTTTNEKTNSSPGQICKAIGQWSGFALYDQWCQTNCDEDNCPIASCKCIPNAGNNVQSNAESFQGPPTATTTMTLASTTTQRMKVCDAGGTLTGEFWNDWCKRKCAEGYCPAEWCVCT
ncbi:hypothetical protein CHS0354_019872 [Potamilus streckersoni]|uniref:Chitin-binding type-4 domain-containing protein n=1 Tax=Potamilus streckersoni TaxID=2493646 RepID=A0AAE0SUS3_9BIVA|nr:hypothetical protein CHS0354_019872 [Potamilus streckersoni]